MDCFHLKSNPISNFLFGVVVGVLLDLLKGLAVAFSLTKVAKRIKDNDPKATFVGQKIINVKKNADRTV